MDTRVIASSAPNGSSIRNIAASCVADPRRGRRRAQAPVHGIGRRLARRLGSTLRLMAADIHKRFVSSWSTKIRMVAHT